MSEVILDALLDSLKIFIFVFAFNFIFSFIGKKLAKNKISVPLGATLGLIPQCGFSVVAAERFKNKQLTAGTLLAVFIATSDEAIPVMLTDFSKFYLVFPLLAIKFVLANIVGYLTDLLFGKIFDNRPIEKQDKITEHSGCGCGHNHVDNEHNENGFLHEHILHPLIHAAKTFAVVLIFNLIFSTIIYYIGEDALSDFLKANSFLAPLFSTLVGLIPNCASSVIIAQLFVSGSISFGACLSGLIANSGIALTILFGKKCNVKINLFIIGILVFSALLAGYICCIIIGF